MAGKSKSKQKGSAFERQICVRLSLWVTNGESRDLFWRSAMSGGRATRGIKRGEVLSRQAGDITAVAPEGHVLTDKFYIELKHLKDIELMSFVVSAAGMLWREWIKTTRQASAHNREPMMIVKQNNYGILVLTSPYPGQHPRRVPLAIMRGVHMYSFDALLQERFTVWI